MKNKKENDKSKLGLGWVVNHYLSVPMSALVIMMACATAVFIFKGCASEKQTGQKISPDSISCTVKFSAADSLAVKGLQKDSAIIVSLAELKSYIATTDSLIASNNARIDNRMDNLVADIRQETNNNLDKNSAWLAFWITVLGVVGVVCPIAYQAFNAENIKEKIKDTEKELQDLKDEIRETGEAYSIKMEVLSYDIMSQSKTLELDPRAKSMYLCSVKNHLSKLTNSIGRKTVDNPDANITDTKVRVFSVLVNLESFLRKLLIHSSYDQGKNIQDTIDIIDKSLGDLVDISDTRGIKMQLQRISDLLGFVS